MKKTQQTDSLYIGSIDKLRSFIQLAAYGCYSRTQMKKRLQRPGMYDKRLEILKFILSSDYWKYRCEKKVRHFFFYNDTYHTLNNYLYPIFSLRSIDIQRVLCTFIILHILQSHPQGLTQADIIKKANDALVIFCKNISPQYTGKTGKTLPGEEKVYELLDEFDNKEGFPWNSQLQRRIHDLEDYGYIQKNEKKRYTIKRNPLTVLSADEKLQLSYAVSFYSAITPISLPGYDLLKLLRRNQEKMQQKYQVRNTNPITIINSPLLFMLRTAIVSQKNISFSYNAKRKEWTGLPLKLQFDRYQRSYVLVAVENNIKRFKISQITDLKIRDKKTAYIPPKCRQSTAQIHLQLLYASPQEHEQLIFKIHSRFPQAEEYDITPSGSQCTLTTPDVLSLVPWLRTLHPQIKILSDNKGNKTITRIKEDVQEALNNYERFI